MKIINYIFLWCFYIYTFFFFAPLGVYKIYKDFNHKNKILYFALIITFFLKSIFDINMYYKLFYVEEISVLFIFFIILFSLAYFFYKMSIPKKEISSNNIKQSKNITMEEFPEKNTVSIKENIEIDETPKIENEAILEDGVLKFYVQGSATEPYRVSFWQKDGILKSACTCQAGKKGMYCKHRFQLIDGDVTNLKSDNYDDLLKLNNLLEKTNFNSIYSHFCSVKKIENIYKNIYHCISEFRKGLADDFEIPENIDTVSILSEKGFVLKFGRECRVYNSNYEYLGTHKMNINQLNKKFPELLTPNRVPEVFTYNTEIINALNKYNRNEVKEAVIAMKDALKAY